MRLSGFLISFTSRRAFPNHLEQQLDVVGGAFHRPVAHALHDQLVILISVSVREHKGESETSEPFSTFHDETWLAVRTSHVFRNHWGRCGSAVLPAMICSIQTYGDEPARFHPHLHCLVADGLVLPDGSFFPLPRPDPLQIMLLFRHKLLKILLAKQKISQKLVDILLSWRHPGFSLFQGDSLSPDDHEARQRLARYCVHPPIALDRLHYDQQSRQVNYDAKNHRPSAAPDSPASAPCPALDFLAALCTHIPDAGQQLIRYYGQWSHLRRARARHSSSPPAQPTHSPNAQDDFARHRRRSWARLSKKLFEADPLLCPRCGRAMKLVSLIDNSCPAVEKILRHLKLWDRPERPPPLPPARTLCYDAAVVDFDDAGQLFERSE